VDVLEMRLKVGGCGSDVVPVPTRPRTFHHVGSIPEILNLFMYHSNVACQSDATFT